MGNPVALTHSALRDTPFITLYSSLSLSPVSPCLLPTYGVTYVLCMAVLPPTVPPTLFDTPPHTNTTNHLDV